MDFLRKTWLLWLSLLLIVVGFVSLDQGRFSIGPILLVAGYCLGLPVFLFQSFRRSLGE